MKNCMALCLSLVLVMGLGSAFAVNMEEEGLIALHIGSPLILDGEEMKSLDSENPGVVPIIHKSRTLVPLRALSEHFGAEVSYDSAKRIAEIVLGGKEYRFPIGENHYDVVGGEGEIERIVFDTETLIREGRTLVPLRVIAEDILSMKVGYDSHVITISKEEIQLDDILLQTIKGKIGQALKVNTREELVSIVGNMESRIESHLKEEAVFDSEAPATSESTDGQGGSSDWSQTNEQVEGINEADVVKTDGEYIYVATGDSLKVYRANEGRPVLTDQIKVSVDGNTGEYVEYSELYIHDGSLVVLGRKGAIYNWIRPMPEPAPDVTFDSVMPHMGRDVVYMAVYDLDKDGKLDLARELELEGDLLSSRKKDNHVYLVVNKYMYYYRADGESLVPMIRDTAAGENFRELAIDSILYYPGRYSPNYLMLAAIDIEDHKKEAEVEAFLGSGSEIYMSNEALYVTGSDYTSFWGNVTTIARFSIDGTKIGYTGGGMVEGNLLNQFSMDEYKGNLRLATTSWQRESLNSVYVLDSSLNEIGAVKNLAPGERIYSARFMGDMGYIVTFRQVDPLFVLDLSDGKNPRVTGELKVPGFSNYLHPIGNDVLLGIGHDVDENTGWQRGIKLSLFDVSDHGKPREIGTLILGDAGSSAEVLYNHKALMTKPSEDMVGFDVNLAIATGDITRKSFNGGVIIRAREDGELRLLKEIPMEGMYGKNVRRLVYIGDVLYYVTDDGIRAFRMLDFTEIK